jgi:peptide/nickel transport system substrate-binding protein
VKGMPVTRRRFLELAVASATVGVAARNSHAGEIRRGGTLVVGTPTEPPTLTSALASQTDGGVSGKVFDSLIALDFAGKPEARLALKWAQAADGLSFALNLRPGVLWHDGRPFTSRDVAFSILQVWKVFPSRGRATYANVTAIETPDALTAVIRLSKPAPYLLSALTSWDARVLPAHLYADTDILNNSHNNAPIGTGPFRFVRWERGSHVVLERNPGYWNAGEPYLDQIIIRFITDPGAAAAALETGQIHISDGIAPPDVARLKANANILVLDPAMAHQPGVIALEFNLDRVSLADVRVRRAFAHAIDRQFIADNIWLGNAIVADGPVPPEMKEFYTADQPRYPYDPHKAEDLLEQAGFKRDSRGTRLSLFNDPLQIGATPNLLTAQYLRNALGKVGVRLQVRSADFGEYVNRVFTRRDFDTTISSNTAGPDPAISIQRLYWSKAFKVGVSFSNAMHYSSPDIDALLEQGQVELDVARRRDIYNRFQRLAQTDLARLPLVATHPVVLARRGIVNIDKIVYGVSSNFADLSFSS